MEVFHLGAEAIVGSVAESPLPAFETNVRGTWTLLDACLAAGVERVVVASSDKAYGAHAELPYREEYALQPTTAYEASKAAADIIARSYAPAYGLAVAVTRFANTYGGGDLHFSRIVPEAVCAAIDGRPPVLRSDGSPERDFLYVEDAADAYIAIASALDRADVRGEAFNAGGRRPHRVGDVVAKIAELAGTGVEPEVRGEGKPEGEIDRQFVDGTKIRERCGWAAHGRPRRGARANDRLVPVPPRGAARAMSRAARGVVRGVRRGRGGRGRAPRARRAKRARQDSNLRPPAPEAGALSTELRARGSGA